MVWNGTDAERFKPNMRTRARIRLELGLDDSVFVFLAQHQAVNLKGTDKLLIYALYPRVLPDPWRPSTMSYLMLEVPFIGTVKLSNLQRLDSPHTGS